MMIIPVISVGGQYNHLIARKLRELGVDAPLIPMSQASLARLEEMGVSGLVIGGGPQRAKEAYEKGEFSALEEILKKAEFPILTICVTHQVMVLVFGGDAGPAERPEYGPVPVYVDKEDELFREFPSVFIAWESHNDEVKKVPPGFEVLAHSKDCAVQAVRREDGLRYGVQFHPEVKHTEYGELLFKNFVDVCKAYI